jgi:hypothetical protein
VSQSAGPVEVHKVMVLPCLSFALKSDDVR